MLSLSLPLSSASLPTFTSLSVSQRLYSSLSQRPAPPLRVSGSLPVSRGLCNFVPGLFLLLPASPLSKPTTCCPFSSWGLCVGLSAPAVRCPASLRGSQSISAFQTPPLPHRPHILCVLAWVSHSPSLSLTLSLRMALPCTSISPGLRLVALSSAFPVPLSLASLPL